MTAIYADLNMLIDDKRRNFDDKKMPIAVNNATRYLMFFPVIPIFRFQETPQAN